MSTVSGAGTNDRRDAPVGRLVGDLSSDVSTLIRDEMQLAKLEITASVRKAGIGAGLFGAAGVLALYGGGALVATAILGLALVLDAWLAALIVAVVLLALAGGVALAGRSEVSQAAPDLGATQDGVRRDVDAAKGHRA